MAIMSKKGAADLGPVDTIDTLIGHKAEFTGDIMFSGGLRVDGKIVGNISSKSGDGASSLVLSESGEIDGNVDVAHILVNGTINGNVRSSGKVELQPKAKVNGDLHYKIIEMQLGSVVNGGLFSDGGKDEISTLKTVPNPGEKKGVS